MSMTTKGVRGRAAAAGSAVAASLLLTLATSPAASADTMRTLNLDFYCATGEAYGLEVDTGSGFYTPNGSSYAVGEVKSFTVFIPAGATTLRFMPLYCDNQPSYTNPSTVWRPYSLTAGTSTINADGYCQDYSYYGYLVYDCTISSLTYS
jgi:hypothetical protein